MSTATLLAYPSTLDQARQNHAQGNLLQAAESYRQALQSDPYSPQALLGLSLIARQSNQLQPALRMAEAALAVAPQSALAWANLGDTLNALHQIPSAKAALKQALALQPSLTAAHYGLGNALALEDDFAAALGHFSFAARQTPTSPECHFAQAFAHGKLGEHIPAIAAYRRAVQLRPSFAAAWLNLGVELVADGRDQLAEPCYHQSIESIAASQGEHTTAVNTRISAHLNLGHLHRSRRQFGPAQQHYEAAHNFSATALADAAVLRLSEIHVAFAYLYLEQQQFPQAWQALSHAEAADPAHQNAEIPNARGILLLAEHTAQVNPEPYAPLVEEAIQAFKEAEAQGHKTAASNRGNALLRLGHCAEAEAAHQSALNRDPHHPGVRYNLALTQLRLGNFAHGWPNYEIRWQFREVHPRPRIFPQPRWQGEPLAGPASLLIYSEQGLGDTIQFLRYLPLVAEHSPATHIILEVQPSLVRLLAPYVTSLQSTVPGLTVEILPHGQPPPPFTHHVPLLSLPAIFQATPETIPGQIPYLKADPQFIQQRAVEISVLGDHSHLKIGLNWAGNPNYGSDYERSTTLQALSPLLEIPNLHWLSLQNGPAAQQISQLPSHLHLRNASEHDQDLADTAALIASLDLIITTDTAIAHLAGALGKPLWLLLPWQSDWRWMQDQLTTPWYPQARLFRQSSPHNWPELIDRVARELFAHLEDPGGPHLAFEMWDQRRCSSLGGSEPRL